MVGVCCGDISAPLLNALSVACNAAGYRVNYGAARSFGSAASAVSGLAIGFILSRFDAARMLIFLLIARILCLFSLSAYPKIPKYTPKSNTARESCSIPRFFARYRLYCFSLLGIAFLGMFHAMTENYMIAIMGTFGGNSSHVGTALFIASITATPVIFFFGKIRSKIGNTRLMKIAALSFFAKSVCLYFAKSIGQVYLLQLFQLTSYGLLHPAQVYYANAKVGDADMVKGQAFITAAYALGCAAGNFAGGQLLNFGVKTMLLVGIAMSAAGALILLFTVNRDDFKPHSAAKAEL